MYFNHSSFQQVTIKKHISMNLDKKVNFHKHLNNIISKVDKISWLLPNFQAVLFRSIVRHL